jgi:predicted O-methyltransferase YrrM
VAYGVSSAYILKALEENGYGSLDSVDLPPPGREAQRFRGVAVPDDLKGRWTLHSGFSRRILPPLLNRLGKLDMFVHDSNHTYRNMSREFEAVWPHLRGGGALVADDVGYNRAFREISRGDLSFRRVVRARENEAALFGLAIKARPPTNTP